LKDILPPPKKKNDKDALDYIFERTFMRPRDILDYLNTCLRHVVEKSSVLTWSTLTQAEVEFSQRRLDSVIDEWKDSFFGLPAIFSIIRRLGTSFMLSDISDEDMEGMLISDRCNSCPWLRGLREAYLSNFLSMDTLKLELLKAVYLVGLVGYKHSDSMRIIFAFDKPIGNSPDFFDSTTFHVHRMFWSAFNFPISARASAGE
jgi:hypothetical protein